MTGIQFLELWSVSVPVNPWYLLLQQGMNSEIKRFSHKVTDGKTSNGRCPVENNLKQEERERFLLNCSNHTSVCVSLPSEGDAQLARRGCLEPAISSTNVPRSIRFRAIISTLPGMISLWTQCRSKLFALASSWLHLSATSPGGFNPRGWVIQVPRLPGGHSAHYWPQAQGLADDSSRTHLQV